MFPADAEFNHPPKRQTMGTARGSHYRHASQVQTKLSGKRTRERGRERVEEVGYLSLKAICTPDTSNRKELDRKEVATSARSIFFSGKEKEEGKEKMSSVKLLSCFEISVAAMRHREKERETEYAKEKIKARFCER